MFTFKDFLVGIKGFFKRKTPSQEMRNRIFWQQMSGLRFKFKTGGAGPVFTAYMPDSFYAFNAHPEFKPLIKKFISNNKHNNGGDTTRLLAFILNCKQVLAEGIEGDFAELGVWRGNTASVLAYFGANANRLVYLFDTFEGFKKEDLTGIDAEKTVAFNNTSIQMVKDNIGENDRNCIYVKGFFPGSLTKEHEDRKYAIVSLDCDLYAPTKAGLTFFYVRMPKGGMLFLHDYSSLHWEGSKQAIDEFCKEQNEFVILMPDKSGSAFIRKSK